MRFVPWLCPNCHGEAVGSIEEVISTAYFESDGDGCVEHSGHTHDGDGEAVTDEDGRRALVCDAWCSLPDGPKSGGWWARRLGDDVTLPEAEVRTRLAHKDVCDEAGCPGWFVSREEQGSGTRMVMRCDTCAEPMGLRDDDVNQLREAQEAVRSETDCPRCWAGEDHEHDRADEVPA